MVAPRRPMKRRGITVLGIVVLISTCFLMVTLPVLLGLIKNAFRSSSSTIEATKISATISKTEPEIALTEEFVKEKGIDLVLQDVTEDVAKEMESTEEVIKQSTSEMEMKNKCWLKSAFLSRKFIVYSHRSYFDYTAVQQPSCEVSLSQLKAIGVNHLDLDIVIHAHRVENYTPRLIVAHPMEYKHTSNHYSPCANVDFNKFIGILKRVYGEDFFISLEPKANWGNTTQELEDTALTNLPSTILEKLLEAVKLHGLKGKCAAIVDINPAQADQELELEKKLLEGILEHCQLFKGIGFSYDPLPQSMGDYDKIMPTIEFHPNHPKNTEHKTIPKELLPTSVFWVVDNEEQLELVADMRPNGIVSNSPTKIISILYSNEWCSNY